MADPSININVTLGNATHEVEAFGQALARVDARAQALFATLQNLSLKHEQQGFLGMGEQRTLDRTTEQWHRAGQLLDVRRLATLSTFQRLQEQTSTIATDPALSEEAREKQLAAHARRVERARQAAERLTTQQLGREYLQRQLTLGVFSGEVAGPTIAWQGGPSALERAHATLSPPGPITNLQWAHADLQLRQRLQREQRLQQGMQQAQTASIYAQLLAQQSPLLSGTTPQYQGRFTPWQPGMRPPPQYLSGTTPQYQGRFTPWQPGMTNPNLSGTTPQYQGRFTPWQPGMTNPNLSGTTPQYLGQFSSWAPPTRPGLGERVGETVNAMGPLAMGLGRGAQWASRIGWAAIGYQGYQLLSQGMQTYETRALGTLRLGAQMDEQYGTLNETVMRLRQSFALLARDSVDTMGVLSRTVGTTTGVDQVASFALAHGLRAPSVAANYGTLALYSGSRTPNLSAIEAIRRQSTAPTLPTEPFQEAVAQMAQVGGTSLLPLQDAEYARYATMFGLFGSRYSANPAQAFAQFTGNLSGPKGVLGDTLMGLALDRRRQSNPMLTIGTGPDRLDLNLNNYNDWLLAKEQVAVSPELQDLLYAETQYQYAGQPQMQELAFGQGFGITSPLGQRQAWRGVGRAVGEAGSIAGYVRRGGGIGDEAARIARLQETPQWDIARRQAESEYLGETGLISTLERFKTEIVDTTAKVAKALDELRDPVQATREVFTGLSSDLQGLLAFGMIVSGAMTSGTGLGLPLLYGGAALATGATIKARDEAAARQQQTQPRRRSP